MIDHADAPTPEEVPTGDADLASFWQMQIALAENDAKEWIESADACVQRYRNEQASHKRRDAKKFNIFYSNVETLKSALYVRTAKPDVRRRFADRDPVSRDTAMILERGLEYCNDLYDVDTPITQALHDHLVAGRGVVRVDYEPVFGQEPVFDPFLGMPLMDEDGNPVMEDIIVDQHLVTKHVFWRDFLHSPCRAWDECWWIAFRHKMTREDLRENGFEDADEVPLNWCPKEIEGNSKAPDDLKRAEVFEVWDKTSKRRIWIVKGFPRALRVDPDPYELEGFWPTQGPLNAIPDTETMIPVPEFHMYKDQADDLDEITARISRLTRALKRRGVFDQSVPELRRLARAADNEFIPVENYAAMAQKGGLVGAFQTEDIAVVAQVLLGLYQQRDMLLSAIREVTGISDIMRGESKASETAHAQQLKAQFGSQRLRRRQRQVQTWIRDLYRIKAEMIAEHFEPEKLQAISGMQVSPEMVQLMRADHLRGYRIDVETDSTVFEDEQAEKHARVEVLTAIGGFLQQAIPAVQQAPQLGPLLFEMLSFGVRSFKAGRQLEDIIDQTAQDLMQAYQSGQMGQPGQEGGQGDAQQTLEIAMQEAQLDVQKKQAMSQISTQEHMQKRQIDAMAREHEHALEQALGPGYGSIQ